MTMVSLCEFQSWVCGGLLKSLHEEKFHQRMTVINDHRSMINDHWSDE